MIPHANEDPGGGFLAACLVSLVAVALLTSLRRLVRELRDRRRRPSVPTPRRRRNPGAVHIPSDWSCVDFGRDD